MMLIYSNCCVYNPPEHNVRRDCELVFVYFRQEYEKLVNKLHQQVSFYLQLSIKLLMLLIVNCNSSS